jgi:hypothetical protein
MGDTPQRSEVGSEVAPEVNAPHDSHDVLAEFPHDLAKMARTETISDMWATLAEAGVPPPPVPLEVAPKVRQVANLHWGTFEVDPLDLYVLRPFVEWVICEWDRQPAFLFGRYDSAARASVLTLFVSRGPVAVLAQHPWDDDAVHPVLGAAEVAATYEATRLLLDRATPLRPPARFLLHVASSQDVFTLLDLPEAPEHFLPAPAEPIYHAPRRYEGLEDLFSAAVESLPD